MDFSRQIFNYCERAADGAFWAAVWAAKGVPFREPLNPCPPADDQQIRFPDGSEILMIVLLNVARM